MEWNEYRNVLCSILAHEANRLYCESLGDHSQPHWVNAPAWQKDSAILGVREALRGATPSDLHESWMKQKLNDGWTYGAVKDPVAKSHPCLVPYKELPETQRIKDKLFRDVVRSLNEALIASKEELDG